MKIISILIVAFVVILLIAIIALTVYLVKKGNKDFEKNKKCAVAIIDGKATESSSNNVIFTVKIPDLGNDYSHNLQGVYNVKKANGKLNTDYPYFKIGDEVQVEYARKKIAGMNVVDVRLRREMYDYPR